jgi:hypothetical protein
VPESPHIRVYIHVHPVLIANRRLRLHRSRMRNPASETGTERVYRTQEVGGSNPPSSIASKALRKGHIGFRGANRTGREIPLVLGTSCRSSPRCSSGMLL